MTSKIFRFTCIAAAIGAVLPTLATATPPADSAYVTDPQSSHVQDATSERIGTVNMITCIMKALAPDLMVNQGNYLALIDENACNGAKDSTANSGASGGAAGAPSYTSAIVNSARTSNNDPMIAKIWIDEADLGGQPGEIFVKLTATAAPSAGNPYGVFHLDFSGRQNGTTTTSMQGMLDASASGLQFYQTETRGGQSETTQLALNAATTASGAGEVKSVFTNGGAPQTTDFLFSYDANYFHRSDGTVNGDQCYNRDATVAGTGYSVWRYGLYDATSGARVDIAHPGFPITYTDPSTNTTYQGYLGYWGLSLPPQAMSSIHTGSQVVAANYGGATATQTPYSVVKAGGKLTKYTAVNGTLDRIDQIRFNTWVGNAASLYTGATSFAQYEMYWDNTTQAFVVTGIVNCGSNGCQTAAPPPDTSVNPSNPTPVVLPGFWLAAGGISGWSNSLGGELFIDLSNYANSPVASTVPVVYRTQDTVYPGTAGSPTHLYCLDNCPTAATIQGFFVPSHSQTPYVPATYGTWGPVAPGGEVAYTFDATTGLLTDANLGAVVVPPSFDFTSADQAQQPFQNGLRTGRMVDALGDATCAGNPGAYCDASIGKAAVYYVWETGPNAWNQFVGVKDANNQFVQIDAPWQVSYTVPAEASYGSYSGTNMLLQYGGFGQLNGIPGTCVSQVDNQPVACNVQNARWVPEFAIPMADASGTPSTVTRSGQSYLVKWLDREIRFNKENISTCSALTLPTGLTLPTSSSIVDTSDPQGTAYIGAKPTVTGAPKVIQGIVQ